MKKKKQLINVKEKKEIFWNVINSIISGSLVLLGSFATSGEIELRSLLIAFAVALVVSITKFKEYWDGEKGEYTAKLFKFI